MGADAVRLGSGDAGAKVRLANLFDFESRRSSDGIETEDD